MIDTHTGNPLPFGSLGKHKVFKIISQIFSMNFVFEDFFFIRV